MPSAASSGATSPHTAAASTTVDLAVFITLNLWMSLYPSRSQKLTVHSSQLTAESHVRGSRRLVHGAALHDPDHAFELGDVGERIAGDGDDVGQLAGLDGAD